MSMGGPQAHANSKPLNQRNDLVTPIEIHGRDGTQSIYFAE